MQIRSTDTTPLHLDQYSVVLDWRVWDVLDSHITFAVVHCGAHVDDQQ